VTRDVAWHGLGGGLSAPKHKYIPPPQNEMKPISPFGFGLMFFDIFDHLKEPAEGGRIFGFKFFLAQTLAEISPPPTKNSGYVPACDRAF